jgi:phage terminase small subunit
MDEMPVLTDKQRVFVEEYLTCWNAAEAARKAGYPETSARQIGSENLSKPDINAYIQQRLKEKAMSADEVLARLADHASGSLDDFLTATGRSFRFDIVKARKAGKMHLLKSISKGPKGVRFELRDPQSAMDKILRVAGKYKDKVEVTFDPVSLIEIVKSSE